MTNLERVASAISGKTAEFLRRLSTCPPGTQGRSDYDETMSSARAALTAMPRSKDTQRLNRMGCRDGGTWYFTPQKSGGVYVWESPAVNYTEHPKGVFCKSLRTAIDNAAMRAERPARRRKI